MSRLRKQLETWRDSYINIVENNNNMLNQDPAKSKAISLNVTDYFTYAEFWRIAVGRGDRASYALRSLANTDPRYNPIEWTPVKNGVATGDLSYLDALIKAGYDTIVQKGENPICLTFGRLDWKVKESGSADLNAFKRISTPIIVIPVKLNKIGNNYWLMPTGDEAMVNPALIKRYKAEGGLDFPLPIGGQWIDSDYFEIEEYFKTLEDHFSGNLEIDFVSNYVCIDIFNYGRMCMYRDVARHMPELERNKILQSMMGMVRETHLPPLGLDKLDPKKFFPILDADASQSDVVEHFHNGDSFILEGPPGTGKTQTIVNMISDALMSHKKVLFVSGKMSALTTVKKKLKMNGVNIDKRCMLINAEKEDDKNSLTEVYSELSSSYHATQPHFSREAYLDNIKELEEHRNVLVGYNEEFYSKNNFLGMALYDLIGRLLQLGYDHRRLFDLALSANEVKYLTREEIKEAVKPVRDVERLLSSILEKGDLTENAWYGFRDLELTNSRETQIRAHVSDIMSAKESFERALTKISTDNLDSARNIATVLVTIPLITVANMINEDLSSEIANLYFNSEGLNQHKRYLELEIKRALEYKVSANKYYFMTTGKADEEPLKLKRTKNGILKSLYGLKYTEIQKRLKEIKGVESYCTKDILADKNSSPTDIEKLAACIKAYSDSVKSREKIKGELLESFNETLLSYDYKGLLNKFKVSWTEELKNNKAPFLYDMKIAKFKKCSKDVVNTDFTPQSVYAVLEKLDLYHSVEAKLVEYAETLKNYEISDVTSALELLDAFAEMLFDYVKVRLEHQLSGFIINTQSFAEFVAEKKQALADIETLAGMLCLKREATVKELTELVDDYETIYENNKRILETKELTGILPTVEKNVLTNWAGILGLIDLVEKVKTELRDENRSKDEDYEVFQRIIKAFVNDGIQGNAADMLAKYDEMYANNEWFDVPFMKNAHVKETMTYSEYRDWLAQISNQNNLLEYISYRKNVELLSPIAKKFHSEYIVEGRREYPINKMGDFFEMSLLYKCYCELISQSTYVKKMAGLDGITTVQDIEKEYAKRDEENIKLNRLLLDASLHSDISHSVSNVNNLHGYLSSPPSGSGVSVRRLLKHRQESIQELSPCIMMSVYSVSKLLEFERYKFDVVIFDEASQIPAEDALTSLMRATSQVVISGDPKQMPAISYFAEKVALGGAISEDEAMLGDSPSIIDFIVRTENSNIAYKKLNTHYRSRHESLIKYSNKHPELYGGSLVTFPSPTARSRDFGISDFCLCNDPKYAANLTGGDGKNEYEAEVVVDFIKEHFEKYPIPTTEDEIENYKSLGVVVFGTNQKACILNMMKERKDPTLNKVLTITDKRIFFITPVDAVQGDEMNVIVISLTYGRNKQGALEQNWGHMNRLPVALFKFNVAITRARENLKVVRSITSQEITNPTLNYIKMFLQQLEEMSERSFISNNEYNTEFVSAVGKICESVVGKDRVVYNYGENPRSYRVPISILSRDKQSIALGVMCEVNRRAEGLCVREYARTCPKLLELQGWENLHYTYAVQWIRNYNYEKSTLVDKLKSLL